jgi:hypothetical protein
VLLGTSTVTGVDFGYSFDVVVNKADAGQGSLRQFLLNANALANTGLAQAGRRGRHRQRGVHVRRRHRSRPARTSANSTMFNQGVVTIAPTTALPAITDPIVRRCPDAAAVDGAARGRAERRERP